MKVDEAGNITTIKDTQGDLIAFVMKITHQHKTFSTKNIIVDLTAHHSIKAKDLKTLLPLSKTHRKQKLSFVVVADVDFNEVDKNLVIVPTLLEANDIIAMEEIERDLGF